MEADASEPRDAGVDAFTPSLDASNLDAARMDADRAADAGTDGGMRIDTGATDAASSDAMPDAMPDAGPDDAGTGDAAAGPLGWPQVVPGSSRDELYDLAVDLSSNVYALVGADGTVITGGEEVMSEGRLLLSYDPTGALRWARTYVGSDLPTRVATDPIGNVYLGGVFSGTVDFDGAFVTTAGGALFLYSLGSDGSHRWFLHDTAAGSISDRVTGLHVDESGILLAGIGTGFVTFGDATLGSVESRSAIALGIGHDGSHQFAWSSTGGRVQRIFVARSSDGGFFAAVEYYNGDLDVGGGPIPVLEATGHSSVLVARYGADGSHVWSRRILGQDSGAGPTRSMRLFGLVTDELGNPSIYGFFKGELHTDEGLVSGTAAQSRFLIALDDAGSHRWQRFSTTSASGVWIDASRGASGSILLVGGANGTSELGTPPGSSNAVLAEYGVDGTLLGSRFVGGPEGSARGAAVAWDATEGRAYVGGTFNDTIEEAGRTLIADPNDDVFITR